MNGLSTLKNLEQLDDSNYYVNQMFGYSSSSEEEELEIEEIKKKLSNQNKNIELVFSYLDDLMEKKEYPKPIK